MQILGPHLGDSLGWHPAILFDKRSNDREAEDWSASGLIGTLGIPA